MPAATSAALPLLLPPVWCAVLCGLRGVPVLMLRPVVPRPAKVMWQQGREPTVGSLDQLNHCAGSVHPLPPTPTNSHPLTTIQSQPPTAIAPHCHQWPPTNTH
jgi:hypothetical protein